MNFFVHSDTILIFCLIILTLLQKLYQFEILTWEYSQFMVMGTSFDHADKLKKYLSLKLVRKFLEFTWHKVLMTMQIHLLNKEYVQLSTLLNFWFIVKTSSKVIPVWNFDSRIFEFSNFGRAIVYTLQYS